MGWRFRKSIRLTPGVRLNLSRRGVGASFGIPGTGLSYSVSPGRGRRPKSSGGCGGCLLLMAIVAGVLIYLNNGTLQPSNPGPVEAPEVVAAHDGPAAANDAAVQVPIVAPSVPPKTAEKAPEPVAVAPSARVPRTPSRRSGLAELALCVLLSGCGAAGGYLLHAYLQGREDAQVDELRTAGLKRLRERLVNDLRRGALEEINLGLWATDCGVSRADADALADDLFLALARKLLADGVVNARERVYLARVAKALRIELERAVRLEDVAWQEHCERARAAAVGNGASPPYESERDRA